MRKISIFIIGLFCISGAYAATSGRAGRNVVGAGTYRSTSEISGPVASAGSVAAAPSVIEKDLSGVVNVVTPEVVIDPELEEIKRKRNICMSNNIGISNTFVWAAKNINTDNYMYMVEDTENPKNNTCYVKVDLKSSDSRIDLSDIKSRYFEMGQGLTCGSWVDESMLEQRILDAKKKARNWGIAASVVGGAGVGVGAMELFGNKLIGGKVMGQKALEGQELLVSQLKVLKKENATEYGRVVTALENLEKGCADSSIWDGNIPTDCDAANPFLGLLEKLK